MDLVYSALAEGLNCFNKLWIVQNLVCLLVYPNCCLVYVCLTSIEDLGIDKDALYIALELLWINQVLLGCLELLFYDVKADWVPDLVKVCLRGEVLPEWLQEVLLLVLCNQGIKDLFKKLDPVDLPAVVTLILEASLVARNNDLIDVLALFTEELPFDVRP